MNAMKKIVPAVLLSCFALSAFAAETAVDRLKTRPVEVTVGQWVIGDQTYSGNEKTKVNETKAKAEAGSCVKVDYVRDQQGHLWIEEITALPIDSAAKCDQAAAQTLNMMP